MQPQFTSAQVTRFWSSIDASAGPDRCWPWTKAHNARGYGILSFNRRHWLAHRVAWILSGGSIPGGHCVLHDCDNPPCCNPAHLWVGTRGDNNRDKRRKHRGRGFRGSSNPRAKLTEEQVREIRRRYAAGGVSQPQLARQYGVTHAVIGYIVRRRGWQHLPD